MSAPRPAHTPRPETQTEAVLALLRSRGAEGLTALDALRIVGSFRLAARIADLRADGHVITSDLVPTPNGARVARYVLVERKRLIFGIDRAQVAR